MYKYTYLGIILIGLGFIACQPNSHQKSKAILTAVEAIQLAEKYVIDQGYTIQKVGKDKRHIVFGSDEFATDTNHILQLRHHTLHPVSTAARQYTGKDGMQKWAVSFVPIERENNVLQAIAMDSIGAKMELPMPVREDWMLGQIK